MKYDCCIAMRRVFWLCIFCGSPSFLVAQTTQGIVTGRVFNRGTGEKIAGAFVTYSNLETNETGTVRSTGQGTYAIPFLPPGQYKMEASAPDYQPQILRRLDLQVAGRVELNFPLRSFAELKRGGLYGGVSLAGQREIVNFFGPDVGFAAPLQVLDPQYGTLQPSLSYVIESDEINGLPLRGRDAYSLLLTVPGATSDSATARSLGLSINGQRPSSSNFLLDGVENNDTLNTGTRIQVAPELVESYRVSTNNFSAEFGRTAGFVANVITKSGTNTFHGTVYAYLGNDVFNANSFQGNLQGFSRRPDRQFYGGFWAGGPIRKDRLWFSSGFERYRRRGNNDPQSYSVAGALALQFSRPDSAAATLLRAYLSPGSTAPTIFSTITLSPTVAIDQVLLLERVDYRSKSGSDRLTGRLAISRQSQPDFAFSPYPTFTSGSTVNSTGVAVEYLHTLGRAMVNDIRLGWNSQVQSVNRAHPEVPTLVSGDGITLPSSPLLRTLQDHGSTEEVSDSVIWIRGRHIITAGGGYEFSRTSSANSFGQAGYFNFPNVIFFLLDSPAQLGLAARREVLPQLMLPNLDRSYRNNQFFGFVQDNVKLSSRIGLSAGVRYDSFGTLKNTGIQDARLALGPGSSIQDRIAAATINYSSQNQNSVYQPSRNNWSGRLGLSYDLRGQGSTILRAGFGIYYDRLFGSLVNNIQFNDVDFRYATLAGPVNFLQPFGKAFAGLLGPADPNGASRTFSAGLPEFYWIDASLRTPHVQTWFGGLQQRVHKNLTVEVSHTGAFGRKLIASDLVNRFFSSPVTPDNSTGLLNPNLPSQIVYRSNSGSSDYLALSAIVRYRSARGLFQCDYTFSHSIDNQSDPLLGQFIGFAAKSSTNAGFATFTRQFDSRIDRGNSDFDQRHNFVFYSLYRVPNPWQNAALKRLLGGWEISQLGAFRSGFPFSVRTSSGLSSLLNNRADFMGSAGGTLSGSPVGGGVQFLNPPAFSDPALRSSSAIGTLGRNSISGPGFFSVDASLSKSFSVPRWESGRISIRADLFNVLNHTNLGQPDPFLTDPTFGVSFYGRTTRPSSSSVLVTPLDETPRQIRFQLKLQF